MSCITDVGQTYSANSMFLHVPLSEPPQLPSEFEQTLVLLLFLQSLLEFEQIDELSPRMPTSKEEAKEVKPPVRIPESLSWIVSSFCLSSSNFDKPFSF